MMHPPFNLTNRHRRLKSPILPAIGVFICSAILLALVLMFYNEPLISEEDEIAVSAVNEMRRHMNEWVAPEVINRKISLRMATHDQAMDFYRVRVIIVLDPWVWRPSDAVSRVNLDDGPSHARGSYREEVERLFHSLSEANYETRRFPVDVEVRLLHRVDRSGKEAAGIGDLIGALSRFAWVHGRLNVVVVRQEGPSVVPSSSSSSSFHSSLASRSPLEWWLPTSEWEVGVLVERPAVFARDWFVWLQAMIRHYAAAPFEDVNAPRVRSEPGEGSRDREPSIYEEMNAFQTRTHIGNPTSMHWMGVSLSHPEGVRESDLRIAEELWNPGHHATMGSVLIQRPGRDITAFFAKPWKAYTEWWLREKRAQGNRESPRASDLESRPTDVRLTFQNSMLQRYMIERQAYLLFPMLPGNKVLAACTRGWNERDKQGDKSHDPSLQLAEKGALEYIMHIIGEQKKPEVLLDYSLQRVRSELDLPSRVRS
ncbi:unnamed protein product [Phytomonas sp. EM1]|nr:unnamed protein product [Phytomonas sp. EM1]|eukprot:CCW62494.1 unnamed protein product [Phytomonas sp. isolate EM1]